MTTTWNASDKSTNTILTDSNHHAQNGTTGSNSGARGTTSHASGKWYLEYSDNVLSGFHSRRGFATAAQDLTDYTPSHMFGVTEGGGADASGGGISAVAGAVVQIAIDIDAGRFWYRKAGDTLWQGSGGSAVALGTSGVDYTGIVAAATALFPAFVSFSNSGQLGATTINCGDRPFASPVPAGYSAWDDDPTNTHAWNPSDKSSAMVLADSNHNATNTTTGGNAGVRASTSHASGKWFLEFSNNVASGFHSKRGFATLSQDLTSYDSVHNFGVTEGGGGDSAGTTMSSGVGGITIQVAIDIDAGKYWFKKTGDTLWVGAGGSPVAVGTSGCDYTGIIAAATAIYPCFITFSNSGQLGATTINLGDRSFEESPPAGYTAWDAGSTNATAGGTTFTVTTSLSPAGSANVPGTSSGSTNTVTVSFLPGMGLSPIDATANGVGFTVGTSLPVTGHGAGAPIDGSKIYEIGFGAAAPAHYQEADYDSIYSRGDRIANGLITAGESAWSNIFGHMTSAFNNNYGQITGDGPALDNGSGNLGQYAWFQADRAIDVRGLRIAGFAMTSGAQGLWSFHGGFGVGIEEPASYAQEFDAFYISADADMVGTTPSTIKATEYPMTPRLGIPYQYYQITWVSGARSNVNMGGEYHLKIAHSILDGGDRQPTNGRPEKQVVFSMSSDWGFSSGTGFVDPQIGLFDGRYFANGSFDVVKNSYAVRIGHPSTIAAVTTVGAYLQFEFPRPVVFGRLLVHKANGADQEAYSGGNPTKYGRWHWEYSKNSGVTWAACSESWSFMEGVTDMLAPRNGRDDFLIDTTDAGVGSLGVTHWRMVLEAGPAFGLQTLGQFVFELYDASGFAPTFTAHFSDDTDGTPVTITPGPPGSPFVVSFSDGDSDGFNSAAFTNIPNPVLNVAFTDDGQFDTWSDLYPSMVVQTIINATGR